MNILSFVALRNVSAGPFAVLAQLKILTTAGVILPAAGTELHPHPVAGAAAAHDGGAALQPSVVAGDSTLLGTAAVLTEVTLSGFASIYFEKVIKTDPETLSIWERNLQLALWSVPVYALFLLHGDADHTRRTGGP